MHSFILYGWILELIGFMAMMNGMRVIDSLKCIIFGLELVSTSTQLHNYTQLYGFAYFTKLCIDLMAKRIKIILKGLGLYGLIQKLELLSLMANCFGLA